MKTYTCGQIQIVRDALELAHDTSDGEDKRKIMGAIYLLDMPLDAFAVVYRLKDEVKDLRDEVVAGDQDIERLTAERDDLAGSDKRLREEIGNLQDGIKHWRDEWSEVCNDNQVLINKAHDDTALLRLALEALKQIDYDSTEDGALNQVITALRERLGEKA